MEKSTRNKVLAGVVLGVAGLVIYKWNDISAMFKGKQGKEPKGDGTGTGTETGTGTGTGTGTQYTPYQLKVIKLQGIVGTGIDGNAGGEGSDTNMKTKAYFPISFAKLGNVSSSNIDAYLALGTTRETSTTTSEPYFATLWRKMTQQGASKPARLVDSLQVVKKFFNRNTGKYETTGMTTLPVGTQFYSGDVVETQANNPLYSSWWLIKTPQGVVEIRWAQFTKFIVN